jgi:prepilin-type processing-associated H-X9-DG protein
MLALIAVVVLAGFLLCGGMVAALLFPGVQAAKDRGRRAECPNNLKQIGLAMHNYHDVYKCFPPAVITDANDQPMRSWRVAILPFIEQAPLYDQYDFSEPWDGPKNRTLHNRSVPTYRCPDDGGALPTETSYVMIVGEGTIGGEPNEAVSVAHIRDGTSNTIMAIEVGMSGIHWMEPRDLTVDEAVTFLTSPADSEFQQAHPGGANVLFADGSVQFLPESVDPEAVRALLTRDDGRAVPPNF